MRFLSLTAALLTFCLGSTANAQGQFAPAITVNESVISNYELSQREKLLEIFRTPGDLRTQAREGLIEDRLKQQELDRAGATLSDVALNEAMEEFASRANLDLAQFTQLLGQNGIDQAALRDFVAIGVSWRDYVRARFNREVSVSDQDIDRAIATRGSGGSEIEVLLSEIIIPAPPPQAARANALAARISQIRSIDAFSAQARQVSALPSRNNGGRLGWLPLGNYPPQIQQIIRDLSVGEVTAPLPITNGVALFQMRGIREASRVAPAPASIDYAAYYIAGGKTDATLQSAANIAARVDTCDDLYGIAKGQPAEVLQRNATAPGDIPSDVALELARLDPGEVSYNLTGSGGQTLVFLMLCDRTAVGAGDADRDTIRNQLRSQRLAARAEALLSNLRSSAIIRTQ